jgi:muramoyltetrapeptide carboxypeptidase
MDQVHNWSTLHGPHPRLTHKSEMKEVIEVLSKGAMPIFKGLQTLKGGEALEAEVTGGCLAILSTSVSTLCMPRLANRILFLEDINEPPYSLDRMLNHLLHAGLLKDVRALIFGEPEAFAPEGVTTSEVFSVLEDFAKRVEIPLLCGLSAGHVKHNRPLPFGIKARLDPARGTLEYLEGYTS